MLRSTALQSQKVVTICLIAAFGVFLLNPSGSIAQVYTVKVTQENGRPVSGAEVTIFTGSGRSDLKTTGRSGTAKFRVDGYIKSIFAYHGSGRYSPQVREINYSSPTYNVKLQENMRPQVL